MAIRGVDASLIHLGLYQGCAPSTHEGTTALADAGFDVLVLCAREYQPDPSVFVGTTVVHAPFSDAIEVTKDLWRTAEYAADEVCRYLEAGKSVLVTCQEGRNRSGFVCAIALCRLGFKVEDAVRQVRDRRGGRALSNPQFVKALKLDEDLRELRAEYAR